MVKSSLYTERTERAIEGRNDNGAATLNNFTHTCHINLIYKINILLFVRRVQDPDVVCM